MTSKQRSRLAAGLLLILVGAFFMALQLNPALNKMVSNWLDWPVYLVAGGLLMLVFGLLGGSPGMAVPACILGGIGGMLFYQNATGDWASWRYAWTLILGFIGVGVMLEGLLRGRFVQAMRDGGGLIVISGVLFLIFSSLTGGPFSLGMYWPVLVILCGVWIVVSALFRKRNI